MRTKVLIAGMLAIASVSFTSCSQDDEIFNENSTQEVESRSANTTEEKIDFYYKGERYQTVSYLQGDSIIGIENPEIEKLLLELDAKPNLVTFAYPDGTCEYFDDAESFHANKERVFAMSKERENWASTFPSISTRGLVDLPNFGENNENIANLFLHDDDNYEDTRVEFDLKKGQNKIEIPHLKPHGMNDKTTSFCAFTLQDTQNFFELFEDDNYKSHCFSFLVTMTTNVGFIQGEKGLVTGGMFCCPDLKNIHVKGTKRSSWNDRITSVRITQQ